ncbi:MAG: hypothetical protein U0R44_01130 [Candidatus Micrarchaeia archaeon]
MQKTLFSGEGLNRKNDKMIKFKVPESISEKGLETFWKNVDVHFKDGQWYPPLKPDPLSPRFDPDSCGYCGDGVISEIGRTDLSKGDTSSTDKFKERDSGDVGSISYLPPVWLIKSRVESLIRVQRVQNRLDKIRKEGESSKETGLSDEHKDEGHKK